MDNELHKCIQSGDITAVEKLITNGASVNKLHGIKGTPLCAAISSNKLSIVKVLLETKKCDINGADYDGEPPLCLAISKGYNDIAKTLVHTKGCNLNVIDPATRMTPLCIAVSEGNVNIVECLVKQGCDINKATERGSTALHYAVTSFQLDIVEILLSGGASLMKFNNNGHNVLHHSVYREEINCTLILLQHLAKQGNDHRKEVINSLTQVYADSCLHLAVEVGSVALVELLVKYQSDINVMNSSGHSPLHAAVKKNSIDLVGCLLKAGADPNVVSHASADRPLHTVKKTSSMLHTAVVTGNLELVKLLLDHGASVNGVDFQGNSPFAVALTRNKAAIARYILENCNVDVLAQNNQLESCLFAALSCSNPSWFIKELVKRGCSVNQQNKDNQTPLWMAVDFECTEVIDVLLDNGCNASAFDEQFGMTVLHFAALNGALDTVRMLLFYGADVDALDANRQTPLAIALECENYDIACVLLECGATARSLVGEDVDNIQDYIEDKIPDTEIQDYIVKLVEVNYPVPKLSEMCRKTVRKHFLEHSISLKLLVKLPLPDKITRYLTFR